MREMHGKSYLLAGNPTLRAATVVIQVLPASSMALPSWAAWDANRIRQSALKRGPQVATSAQELLNLLETLRPKPELERVRAVNDYFNRKIAFKDDRDVWAQADYWATPLEMFELGAGDCEDYALAKYFSLLSTGMSPAKLRLIYVRAQLGGPAGLVADFDNGPPLLLG